MAYFIKTQVYIIDYVSQAEMWVNTIKLSG